MNAKTMFGILTSLVMLAGTACGAADGTSAEADTSVQEDILSAKTFTADSSNVKLLGRNYLADDGTLWVVHSASGVEFSWLTNSPIGGGQVDIPVEIRGSSRAFSWMNCP